MPTNDAELSDATGQDDCRRLLFLFILNSAAFIQLAEEELNRIICSPLKGKKEQYKRKQLSHVNLDVGNLLPPEFFLEFLQSSLSDGVLVVRLDDFLQFARSFEFSQACKTKYFTKN